MSEPTWDEIMRPDTSHRGETMTEKILALPAPLRHLLAAVAAVLLSWGATEAVPALQNQNNVYGATLGALLLAVIAVFTPLVSSYGVGADTAREMGARTPSETL